MNDMMVQDEIQRIYANDTLSDFERSVKNDIIKWANTRNIYNSKSFEKICNDYWNEQFNA